MKEIPITKESMDPNYDLPLGTRAIRNVLAKVPEEDLEGLEGIIISQPRTNMDMNNFGRYDPEKKIFFLFAHYKFQDGTYNIRDDGMTANSFRNELKEEVIFHEIGHHVTIRDKGDEAEYYAIAYSLKINPKLKKKYSDKELKELEKEAKEERKLYGKRYKKKKKRK